MEIMYNHHGCHFMHSVLRELSSNVPKRCLYLKKNVLTECYNYCFILLWGNCLIKSSTPIYVSNICIS